MGAAGDTDYSYDGLDRVARRDTTPFTYAGTEIEPVTDGTVTYGRGASGELLSVTEGGTARLAGLNRHGDVPSP